MDDYVQEKLQHNREFQMVPDMAKSKGQKADVQLVVQPEKK